MFKSPKQACLFNHVFVFFRIKELGLTTRCKIYEGVKADVTDISKVHAVRTIELLQTVSSMTDFELQEHYASRFDAIYFDQVRQR